MGCQSLPRVELDEPTFRLQRLGNACRTLAVPFGRTLDLQTGGFIVRSPEITSTVAVMTLTGRASEVIDRNRGGVHRVVPLARVSSNGFIWTGYRERWQKQGSEQSFRFVEGGFTLHIGRKVTVETTDTSKRMGGSSERSLHGACRTSALAA
jgi:hypothetical protein